MTFDEASFRLVPTYRRVWFIKGKIPEGIFFWSNKKINIFGALINGKKLYHEWHNSLNTVTFYFFLNNFIKKHPRKKFVFIMDNAGYHKTSPIQELLTQHKKRIKIEYLPPYSPELNPTETCWKTIRNNITNSTYYPTTEHLQQAIEQYLHNHFFKLKISNYLCR